MRTSTWENIGTNIKADNITDALQKANLDYTVTKAQIYTKDGLLIPDYVATVREDSGDYLGVVSPNYGIVQNRDAFDFVNYIDEDIKFVKAGVTGTGMVSVIGKLPNTKILGDKCEPYAIFQNSHNGKYGVKSTICPLRVVCQNQFNYAFNHSANTVTVRHSKSVEDRLADAREVLKGIYGYMGTLNDEAERLATIKIDTSMLERYLNSAFKINEEDSRAKTAQVFRRDEFMQAYNQDDNANFRGTAWGIINALADYSTHKTPLRKTESIEENTFLDVTFHPMMMNMLEAQILA